MKLKARDLLEEELYELESITYSEHYIPTRIKIIKEAIEQLESLALKSDCISCRHNKSQEELSGLNEEEYEAFDKCITCCNYYTNNYEEK